MRLAQPFYQLPLHIAVEQLRAEVAALPAEAWVPHPDGVPGNSAVRLISADGGENDAHSGDMRPTRWLAASPGLRQVLAAFGVVWSRSRLMRLAPGAGVPEHADIAHHWHTRVRVHMPLVTAPQVGFHCDGESVHMAAGEAWIFDNWRRHHVVNGAAHDRVHLVADTSGTAAFWQMACGPQPPRDAWPVLGGTTDDGRPLLTEADQRTPVMPAAEVQALLDDLQAELVTSRAEPDGPERIARYRDLLDRFVRDWRQLWALHGTSGRGIGAFAELAERLDQLSARIAPGLVMRTNGVPAHLVLRRRVVDQLLAVDMIRGGDRM